MRANHIWDMGYSGCSRQSYKLPSPMWDRQSPPRAHTRIRLSQHMHHNTVHYIAVRRNKKSPVRRTKKSPKLDIRAPRTICNKK
jgi:hypothetical protein